MTGTRCVAAILGAAAVLAACFSEEPAGTDLSGGDACARAPGADTVLMRDFAFAPAELRIRAGTTVTWLNCDGDPHTSTSDAGLWSSPLIPRGGTFARRFEEAGRFPYHCVPHPFMQASVVVQ